MTLPQEDFTFLATMLRNHSAISITADKAYLVESRLGPVARELGLAGVAGLVTELRRVQGMGSLRDTVVEAMTTNETSFFRDRHPFDALRDVVLPDIIARNAATRRIDIWSAACSTGQELFSVAMLLDAHFPQLADWDVRLLGTDISPEVVRRANAGIFTPLQMTRGLPDQMQGAYFTPVPGGFLVAERLRRRCRFTPLNLAQPFPQLPKFDVVLCRNVLIYFDADVRRSILVSIRKALAPEGRLFLGGAESAPGVDIGFRPIRIGAAVAHRPI